MCSRVERFSSAPAVSSPTTDWSMLGNVFQLLLVEGVWSKTTEENRVALFGQSCEHTHTTQWTGVELQRGGYD